MVQGATEPGHKCRKKRTAINISYMDNPFGSLLQQLQERIKDIAPEIREIDEDKGQLEGYDIKPPVSFPWAGIDFDFRFDDLGGNVQWADGEVIIRLAFPPFSSASSLMSTNVRDKALAYTDYEMKIYQALHGWRPTGFAPFSRRSAVTEKRDDALRVREIRFQTAFEDYSAQDEQTFSPAPGVEFEGTISPTS